MTTDTVGEAATAGAGAMTRLMVQVLGFYQRSISPLFGRRCRYLPTCSEYAMTAIRRFGAGRGVIMAARRLGRCQPFGSDGYDPVPPVGRSGAC